MDKVILGSVVIASMVVPIRAARHQNPLLGLRNAVLAMLVFNLAYLALLRFIYPRVI